MRLKWLRLSEDNSKEKMVNRGLLWGSYWIPACNRVFSTQSLAVSTTNVYTSLQNASTLGAAKSAAKIWARSLKFKA